MNTDQFLTPRESEIAAYLIKGDAKKQIASKLFVSEKTVENHTQNMYKKVNVQSVGAFVTWWFCTNFKIDLEAIEFKHIISCFLICLICVNEINDDSPDMVRTAKVKTIRPVKSRRRNEYELENFDLV